MSARKKISGILLYNKLLHEVSVINEKLPEEKKLSISERRQLVSGKLYPEYKNVPARKLRLSDLRTRIFNLLKKAPRKPDCDVLAIPQEKLLDIDYYAMDEFIEQVLPKCIYIKVDAGEFGQTNIFNTREYKYYSSGVQQITNEINNKLPNRDTNQIPKYDGFFQLRPKKKNDGDPNNYYIHFVLIFPGIKTPKVEKVKIPKLKKTPKQKLKAQTVKKFIEERQKALKAEKSKVKNIRKSFLTQAKNFKISIKDKYIKPYAEQIRKAKLEGEKKRAKKYFDQKRINERQYKEILRQINKSYK
jgi:hypothetical protein